MVRCFVGCLLAFVFCAPASSFPAPKAKEPETPANPFVGTWDLFEGKDKYVGRLQFTADGHVKSVEKGDMAVWRYKLGDETITISSDEIRYPRMDIKSVARDEITLTVVGSYYVLKRQKP